MYLQQYYCFLWLPIRLGSRRKKLPVEWCVVTPALGTIPTRKGLPHLTTRRISIAEELPLAIRCGGLSPPLLCPSLSRDLMQSDRLKFHPYAAFQSSFP